MGPRARARGNPANPATARGHFGLQWGHERALVEIRPIRPPRAAILGFNGATSARSWKWSEVGACGLLWFGLQWGHERALVEISTTNSWSRSTSALQWGHERAL